MRAILIDPFACQVCDLFLPDPREVGPHELLEAVYIALSHPTFTVDSLDGVPLGNSDYLIVSGHGQLQHPPVQRWFRLEGLHFETLAGKGLIVGRDEEGCEVETNYSVSDLDYRTVYFQHHGRILEQTNKPWRHERPWPNTN